MQQRLQRGWNTWDTNTIAGEVLLPEGLEIRLGLKHNTTLNADSFLPTMLIGRQGIGDERVKPGPHAYAGSYSRFEVTWAGTTVAVEAAHADDPERGYTGGLRPELWTSRELEELRLQLFLKEWNEKGHVHENYSAVSNDSDGVKSSDRFYHCGALMGLMEYQELNEQHGAPTARIDER